MLILNVANVKFHDLNNNPGGPNRAPRRFAGAEKEQELRPDADLLHLWHHRRAQDGAADNGVRALALGGGQVLARPHPRRRPLEHRRHGLGQERLVIRLRTVVAGIDIPCDIK